MGSSNPLQARRPGATIFKKLFLFVFHVPILSRPEGPELRYTDSTYLYQLRFQSSPGPKARSYVQAGQTYKPQAIVPILSRPEGPELRERRPQVLQALQVPILSRPEGPELPASATVCALQLTFQSSPGPKARSYVKITFSILKQVCSNPLQARRPGATLWVPALGRPGKGSNPLQARRPGATMYSKAAKSELSGVPILSRPEGPELQLGSYFAF